MPFFRPYGDLENFCLDTLFVLMGTLRRKIHFSSLRGLREFSFKYSFRPYRDLEKKNTLFVLTGT